MSYTETEAAGTSTGGPVPELDGRAGRALAVEAVVPNGERLLRPGTFARAKLDLGKRQTLSSIPASAVIGDSGVYRVFVVSEDRARERLVTIVERKPDKVLVSDGLRPGEHVATSQLERLADGARIQGS